MWRRLIYSGCSRYNNVWSEHERQHVSFCRFAAQVLKAFLTCKYFSGRTELEGIAIV